MRLEPNAFHGRTAFVTGGGTGLGLAVSRRLGALGARVAVASRDVTHHEELLELGRREGFAVLSLAMDVRRPDQVRTAMRATAERFGGLDVLVNNAAGNFVRPSIRLAPKAFSTVIDIALNGVFTCSREAARLMKPGGAIVNVSAPYAADGQARRRALRLREGGRRGHDAHARRRVGVARHPRERGVARALPERGAPPTASGRRRRSRRRCAARSRWAASGPPTRWPT